MTMGFRNRRSPSNPRAGEVSPLTGRIIVAGVGIISIGLAVMMHQDGAQVFPWLFGLVGAAGIVMAAFFPKDFD